SALPKSRYSRAMSWAPAYRVAVPGLGTTVTGPDGTAALFPAHAATTGLGPHFQPSSWRDVSDADVMSGMTLRWNALSFHTFPSHCGCVIVWDSPATPS